ncbi:MAG TPA: FliM/FliN family flagellar motor switch protein [Terriglobales bacterium]|nr:FliM/FliN family flagellar motor switch protein [Terriglobales bacterium]
MERSLNQDEIDALFRKARGLKTGPTQRKRELARCDFRQAGQITREQARSVNGLHESFARNLGHSLGAYLRTQLDVSLVAIEQLGFGEFMQRLPEVSYVASIAVMPIGVSAAMQLDLALSYPMIDLVLGGTGVPGSPPTDLTEIEEQILESIVALIARELQQVWQPVVDLGFAFERRQPMAQILRLMPPTEKVLALSFELHLPEVRGMMNVILPAVVSTSLLRQLSEAWVYHRRQEDPDLRPRLQRLLGGARFGLELALPPFPVAIRDLLALQPGQVLMFHHSVEQPAQVKVAGRRVFQAQAIRHQNRRAALIQTVQPLAKPEGGN